MEYFKSVFIGEIQNEFYSFFYEKLSNKHKIDKNDFFDFLKTHKFQHLYHNLATDIGNKYFKDMEYIVLQPNPTPRIFSEKQHGTSFHTDYLYGHGKKAITIWVPLYGVNKTNSFRFIKNSTDYNINEESLAFDYSEKLEIKLLSMSENILTNQNECVVFSSLEIHGSPKNEGDRTRYSLDFRMSPPYDKTSNKELHTYLYKGKNTNWINPVENWQLYKFLKYICGNKKFTTKSQHILINNIASEYNLNIVAQEAEFERYGNPIFNIFCSGILEKEFNAIIIASRDVLNKESTIGAKKSKLKIFVANEEKFL